MPLSPPLSRRRLSGLFLPVALSLALGGCSLLPSVGPDYRLPQLTLPAGWFNAVQRTTAGADAPATPSLELAAWWKHLDDPLLDALVDEAIAGGTDLRLAEARLRQARAVRQQAIAGFFPSIAGSTAARRGKTGSQPSSTLYDAGFDASWEIDLFGGTRRGVEAATADLEASRADLADVRVSLVAEVVQDYVDLRAYQQRLAIARANLGTQKETAQIAEWRFMAGLAGATDVEQAKTSLAQTQAAIPDLEIGVDAAKNQLALLLGKTPGSLHERLAETRPLPEIPSVLATGLPAELLLRRPDLIAAERRLAAETARTGQKLAQRFPSLTLGGSFGWQAYSLGALGGSETIVRALTGTLAATLFDGGRLRAAVAAQDAVQEQALVSYEASVLTALGEVEDALVAHAAAYDRIAARRAAVESARKAAGLARQLYQSGLTDFQTVLDTERTRLSAEDGLASAQASLAGSLVKLYKALGGGWSPDQTPNAEKRS